MKLYHGSISAVKKPGLSRGRKNTDFGKGFYTTTSYEQAKKWAIIKRNREIEPDKSKAIATIEQLKTHVLFDQLSFHSAEALKELRFLSSEEVG